MDIPEEKIRDALRVILGAPPWSTRRALRDGVVEGRALVCDDAFCALVMAFVSCGRLSVCDVSLMLLALASCCIAPCLVVVFCCSSFMLVTLLSCCIARRCCVVVHAMRCSPVVA